ncbi:MAG: Ig-like domain repeat protein, partial [Verrucomicrobia bacterium]|nr:Ig-like domain repeat protein [Verrucomicrobiota bacterium]
SMTAGGAQKVKEQYVVLRSGDGKTTWSGGSFLGRMSNDFLTVRASSYNMAGGTDGFWQDHHPAAVSKNGTALPANSVGGSAYHLAPITNYMVLKIVVNDQASAANLAQYPYYQIGKNEGTGTTDFDVAEIIGYNTTLSTADENKVGGYLAGKYGVTATYPPYYLTVKLNNPTLGQQFPYLTDVVAVAQVGEPNNTLTDTVKIYTKLLPDGPVVEHGTTQNGVLFTADLGSSLASGDYEIYATVTNNDSPTPGTATCATQTFTVALPTSTTTTLAATSPSTYGNSVTFTATVAPTPNGGSVQFYDNGDALGSPVAVNTSTGQASISTSLLTVDGGTAHSITADYDGFGIYLGSSADAVDQTVNPANLTVTANGKVRIPGTDNPPLTYMITGYKLAENELSADVQGKANLFCAANASSPEGSYEITCDPSPMSAPNYSFTGVSGYLNVTVGAVPVSNGLTCWYDAGSGVSTDGSGVTTWNDLSGNLHHAARSGTVTLATNDVNSRPSVHLGRGGNSYLTCAALNGMFTKQQYVVVRSGDGKTTWDGSGSFLGRAGGFLQVRTGSCNLYSTYTGFWDDVLPLAVSRNGVAVSSNRGSMPRGGFELGTITDFMILKITVTQPDAANIAAYPGYNIGKCETLGTASMDIAEIVGYDSALSAADEGAVTAYLAAKYAIVVPPSAPTITAITPG